MDPKNNVEASSPMLDLTKLPLLEPEEGVFAAYSNVVNLDWTLDDIRLRFAELIQVPSDEDPTWKGQRNVLMERAAITLSWRQAKNLVMLLGRIVLNYETINGELIQPKLPPSMDAPSTVSSEPERPTERSKE
jgi:hypothetical protein